MVVARRLVLRTCGALCLTAAIALPSQTASLHALFEKPPGDARPMVRWWWFGVSVTKPEILRELTEMRSEGIGGVELAFVYPLEVDDSTSGRKNLPFLSPAMLEMVKYAQSEGHRLGLRIDVTLCSGWPYGGPHIPLALAAARLKTVEVAIPAGATTVSTPATPTVGDVLVSVSVVEGSPKAWGSSHTQLLPLPAAPADAVLVPPAPQARVALFFFASHTRQQVKRAAVSAEGFVLDPFSREAVATHLQTVGEPLLGAFGNTPPYAIFSDSLEAYGADWTPSLPAEFRKRRGYDLLPVLPLFVAGDTPEAQRVRHDYGITLTELINENYLVQITRWAETHGTRFRSQTYGEPAVSFSSQHLVSLPEGEGSQWRQFSTLRWASSANHVFGTTVTSGETFTWLHSPVFRATPLDMKAESDVDFLSGQNLLVFHGWPYSPAATAGDPGWSLYAASALNDHNPWHPVMSAVTTYIARVSQLLRQGQPANQVAILLPSDDAWAGFSPGNVSVSVAMAKLIAPELMDAILTAGYNVDFIDADAIRTVGLGSHQIVILPPTDRLPVETLHQLQTFSSQGKHVFAIGKLPSANADGYPLPADVLRAASITLVPSVTELPKALTSATAPDLRIQTASPEIARTLGFIRRTTPDADIYFLANTSNKQLTTTVGFSARFTKGERWSTDTGLVLDRVAATGTDIDLAPYESAVFVFRDSKEKSSEPAPATATRTTDLSSGWQVQFPALGKTQTESKLTDWMADPATMHFSGEAIYRRDFTLKKLPHGDIGLSILGGQANGTAPAILPATGSAATASIGVPNPAVTRTGPGMRAWFDPPVREAALVFINGHPAGALWHPPYSLNITKLVHAGTNHIEIHVFNTALNAWSAVPPRDYSALKAKYGDRFQMQDLDQVKPLTSGILGEIQLTQQERK